MKRGQPVRPAQSLEVSTCSMGEESSPRQQIIRFFSTAHKLKPNVSSYSCASIGCGSLASDTVLDVSSP